MPAGETTPDAVPPGAGPTAGPSPELTRRPDPHAITSAAQFAEAITRLREQAGVGIRDLARSTGVTSSTLSSWFAGRQLPPLAAVGTLDTVLGLCGVPAGPSRAAWIDALTRVRRHPGQRPADVPAAYRGLESYRIQDAPFFAGRERLVARLVAAVTAAAPGGAPTVLVGPSGSGKSSALQAGLAARLRNASSWDVVTLTPGARPVAALDAALQQVRELKLPGGWRVALVVDQFEELFTLGSPATEQAEFVRRITEPLGPEVGSGPGSGPTVSVVIGLRADFYGAALAFGALGAGMQDHQIVVGPLSPDDLRRAITEPARAAGVQVQAGLVELVLHDAATADPALPLVAFALYRTWRRGLRSRLTVEDYVAVRGVSGAVAAAAEAVHDQLTPAQREVARQLFGRLVVLGEGQADLPHRRTASELKLDTSAGDATAEVLERFVEARLLTATDTDVQLAHPALLTAWPRLRAWLDGDRAARVAHRRLADAATTWSRDGRDAALLHRGTTLQSVREWAAGAGPDALAPVERAFLSASVAAHEREAGRGRRRVRRLQAAVVGVTVLALGAGGLAVTASRDRSAADDEREQSVSRRLAEAAGRLAATDPTTAAQAALLAWRTAPTDQARSALLDTSARPLAARSAGPAGATAVAASADGRVLAAVGDRGDVFLWRVEAADPRSADVPRVTRLETSSSSASASASGAAPSPGAEEEGPQPLFAVAVPRDGAFVAAAGASGVIHRWALSGDTATALPDVPVGRGAILGLATSPDGRTLAATTTDGHVVLYDVRGSRLAMLGTPVAAPVGGLVQAVAFSTDSRSLAAAGSTGRVQLWSLADRAHPAPGALLTGPAAAVTTLTFSPDGRRLAAGSKDRAVYLWQPAAPAVPAQRLPDPGGAVTALGFSPDGAFLAAAGADRGVHVYETVTRAEVATLSHPAAVTGLTYLPDGRTLVTTTADGTLRLWPSPGPGAAGTPGRTVAVGYLSGDRVVTVTGGGTAADTLRVVDVAQPHRPQSLGTVGVGAKQVLSGTLAVAPTGSLVAVGGTTGSVWLFEAPATSGSTGTRLVGTLPAGGGQGGAKGGDAVRALALSPDAHLLAVGTADGTVQLADVSTPSSPRALGAPSTTAGAPSALAFSPDGRHLVAAVDAPARVETWDVTDGRLAAGPAAPDGGPAAPARTLTYAPDGHTVAVGGADGRVQLLDTADAARPRWLGEPTAPAAGAVDGVAFGRSDGGLLLAAAGEDGTVRLWDVADGAAPALRTVLTGPPGALTGVAVDAASRRLAAAGPAGAVLQWDLDPAAAADRVCRVTGTSGDPATWSRALPDIPFRTPCP